MHQPTSQGDQNTFTQNQSKEFYISNTSTKFYQRSPKITFNFNKWTISWWTNVNSEKIIPKFGIYGVESNSIRIMHNIQLFKGNLCYNGIINDYNYEGSYEYHIKNDLSYLNRWNHHVIIFDTSKNSFEQIRWIYNDVKIKLIETADLTEEELKQPRLLQKKEFIESFKSPFPISGSVVAEMESGPSNIVYDKYGIRPFAKNMKVWFGVSVEEKILLSEVSDGIQNTYTMLKPENDISIYYDKSESDSFNIIPHPERDTKIVNPETNFEFFPFKNKIQIILIPSKILSENDTDNIITEDNNHIILDNSFPNENSIISVKEKTDNNPIGSIADIKFYDGYDNTTYGSNGFYLTFNPSDINTTTDVFGIPISIPDPYGSSVEVPPDYYADASGSGNHWLIS